MIAIDSKASAIDPCHLKTVLLNALQAYLSCSSEREQVKWKVSERSVCCRIAMRLQAGVDQTSLSGYFADIEYNRNKSGTIKYIKSVPPGHSIRVTCDILLHGRGRNTPENLLAVEVKWQGEPRESLLENALRLEALTYPYEGFSEDGKIFKDSDAEPAEVCGYILGALLIIDSTQEEIHLTWYQHGETGGSQSFKYASGKLIPS
jgi:hypothetical protein